MDKPIVYLITKINPETVLELYRNLTNFGLPGKVAAKVHSGEQGNQNFLRPEFWKDIIEFQHATVVENNTAYAGKRDTTAEHLKTIYAHGWNMYPFDLLDAEGPDLELKIPKGKVIKKNYVGKNLANYDSMIVLSHFKGHPMGGYGGALKQLSIGCASTKGKCWIHSAGKVTDKDVLWDNIPDQDLFLEAMADAASSIMKMFKNNIVFINVMANMSVDCDCCATAEDPCMEDIGILASFDPVAIDQACIDLVKWCDDPGKDKLLERINSRHGEHTIEAAEKLGIGSRNYKLIRIIPATI